MATAKKRIKILKKERDGKPIVPVYTTDKGVKFREVNQVLSPGKEYDLPIADADKFIKDGIATEVK